MRHFKNLTSEEIWCKLIEDKRVALLGSAGVGKTYTTRQIIQEAYNSCYDVVITASTGIAARNLDFSGKTINSALKFQVCKNIDEYETKKYLHYQKIPIMSNRTLLVIDEISMISKDSFDLILHILKKRNLDPLILIVGDFLQLPPVEKDKEPKFAFESQSFSEFTIIELIGNKRNTNEMWNIFLNRLRVGVYNKHDKEFLKKYAKSSKEIEGYTTLDSRNNDVDIINERILSELPSEEVYSVGEFFKNRVYEKDFTAEQWKTFEDDLIKSIITPHVLKLKVGARVILTKNNEMAGYVNGDTGVITHIFKDEHSLISNISIKLDNSEEVLTIGKVAFELAHPTVHKKDGKPDILANYFVLPVKLAWALTTSKSQGMSIRSVKISPENFFLAAEAYVAFSRCGETLVLDNFDFEKRIKVNEKAINFYKNLEKHSSAIETVSVDEIDF